MKPIETKDCITAAQNFADEHGKEEAYQSATWLFKAQIITQEQDGLYAVLFLAGQILDGGDLLVRFSGNLGLGAQDFAVKLLGRSTDGKLLFGYARLPKVVADAPLPSPRKPVVDGRDASVEVQNFGLLASKATTLRVLRGDRRFLFYPKNLP